MNSRTEPCGQAQTRRSRGQKRAQRANEPRTRLCSREFGKRFHVQTEATDAARLKMYPTRSHANTQQEAPSAVAGVTNSMPPLNRSTDFGCDACRIDPLKSDVSR